MKTYTDSNFETDVIKSDTPVLVDFWAPWCGPCKQIAPALEAMDKDVEGVTIGKLNVDDNPVSPGKYGIRGIPALMLFSGGTPVAMAVGAQTETALRTWLSDELAKL